jgi:diguanylate cyclase (GGDEF)-like protein
MEHSSRVLIVDDEDSNVDMLARRLSRCGYSVVTATDGKQALSRLEESPIDLVLLDQMMPGMTGTDVLRKIRDTTSAQQLPVIMITAVTDSSAVARALDLGANDYVTKPIDFQIALARIRSQLAMGKEGSKVRKSEERHVLAARSAGEGLWDWDLAANTIYCTPEVHRLAGATPHENSYSPRECLSRVHPNDRRSLAGALSASPTAKSPESPEDSVGDIACQFRLMHASGQYRWFSLRGVTLKDSAENLIRRVGSITDVTARLTIDSVTGLANRRVLMDHVESALLDKHRNTSDKFCVLLFDIDHFKHLLSSLTSSAKQQLLVQFAERIASVLLGFSVNTKNNLSAPVLLARLDEAQFGVFINAIESGAQAESLAEQLTRAMLPSFLIEERGIFCSISIGVVIQEGNTQSAEDVLRDAKTAIVAAELRGTGQWALFDKSMRTTLENRLQLEIDLHRAVTMHEFEVFYQSRVRLETSAICGFEALVRWNHPTRGLVPPLEFIPLAEENGLIHEIGMWVLEKACLQTQTWRQEYALADDFEVSVNLSPQQCKEPTLVGRVTEILKSTGLPPSSLNLELTESLLMEDIDESKSVLHSLKSLGIGLKLDDFGTGYSCLKYLCQFPFDSLKIDRSFTKELNKNNIEIEEIVRTIVQMAGNLKMEVVAEGVETVAHVTRLQELGCKYGQGFLFSRPVNAASAEAMLGPKRTVDYPERGFPSLSFARDN